jgi:hypothetical protein
MALLILAISEKASSMTREYLLFQTGTHIVAASEAESMKDTDSLSGRMEIITKGSMSMGRERDMGFYSLMELNTQATGKEGSEKDEAFLFIIVIKSLAIGRMTCWSKNDFADRIELLFRMLP